MSDISIKNDEKVALTVEGLNSIGDPVPLTSNPHWETSDPTIIVLGFGSDLFGVDAITTGKPGMATVQVSDPDTGGFIAYQNIHVVPNDAPVGLVILTGAVTKR